MYSPPSDLFSQSHIFCLTSLLSVGYGNSCTEKSRPPPSVPSALVTTLIVPSKSGSGLMTSGTSGRESELQQHPIWCVSWPNLNTTGAVQKMFGVAKDPTHQNNSETTFSMYYICWNVSIIINFQTNPFSNENLGFQCLSTYRDSFKCLCAG